MNADCRRVLSVIAVLCGMYGWTTPAAAAPQQFAVEGSLRGAGSSFASGWETVTIRLYGDPAGLGLLWEEVHKVRVSAWRLETVIPADAEANPIPDGALELPDGVWITFQPTGGLEVSATQILSAPYALHAESSDAAAALDCTGCITQSMLAAGALVATDMTFDPAASGLAATEVQSAIDEVALDLAGVATVARTGAFGDLVVGRNRPRVGPGLLPEHGRQHREHRHRELERGVRLG